ncbi:dihydropteroate synthase [Poseidonocella sp. HB161398]|uniref:dihydropteroate synthase n=1 Tax=Poseidonocella sp. HB161398 TaxID=2320855 RepID=UPI00198094A2|nr:dihydropteroate synthase [Poseidonocella sp. HB161398]
MPIAAARDRFLAELRDRPLVMGILNATPDSFSDGGAHDAPEAALAHARQMIAEGCDVIDLGGESTRPGHAEVTAEEEMARVLPVLRLLQAESGMPVSIDTYKAATARAAVEAGAAIVNDVWGLQRDPGMAGVVAETGAAVIIMHNRETTDPDLDILQDMEHFFGRSLDLARKAGIPGERILLDPGIGFGKTLEQNIRCLNGLGWLGSFGYPVLLGLSRKRMFGELLGREVGERLPGTLAANLVGIARGVRVIRVHDVAAHADALKVVRALEA